MEKVLKQILGELKKTNNRLEGLEQGQSSLQQGQIKLEQRQGKLEEGQIKLEQGQQRIEERINVIFEQTAGLSEFRTETLQRLDNIDAKFDVLASEMGKHKIDIEMLKKRPV